MKLPTCILALVLALAVVPACKRGTPDPGTAGPGAAGPVVRSSTKRWPDRRTPCARPAVEREPWGHRRSALAVASGEPQHVAADAIVAAGVPVVLDGKFAYGPLSKDLQDELVFPFIASAAACNAVAGAPVRTDGDGRVQAEAAALPAGHHHAWLIAAGDGTAAEAGIWVVPPGTPAVLFDVDGTLTIDDGQLFDDLLGRHTAVAFEGAAAVAQRWADKGYLVIYVTGRPYPLREHTRRWLEAHGFPYGPMFTPDRVRDARPTPDGVGAYKRGVLVELQARGVSFTRVYGNAATDVCAYAEARIPPSSTYIVGNPTGCAGSPAPHPLASYVDHLADVEAQPPAP